MNYQNIEVNRVNGEANNHANYPGGANKRGSNYPGFTVSATLFPDYSQL